MIHDVVSLLSVLQITYSPTQASHITFNISWNYFDYSIILILLFTSTCCSVTRLKHLLRTLWWLPLFCSDESASKYLFVLVVGWLVSFVVASLLLIITPHGVSICFIYICGWVVVGSWWLVAFDDCRVLRRRCCNGFCFIIVLLYKSPALTFIICQCIMLHSESFLVNGLTFKLSPFN